MEKFNSIFEKKNVEYEISSSNLLPFSLSNVVYPSGKNQPPNYSAYYNSFLKKLEENDLYLEQLTLNVKNSRNVPGATVTNSEQLVLTSEEGKKFVLTSNLEPQVQLAHKVVSEIGDSLSMVNDLSGLIVNFVLFDDRKYVAGTQNGLYCAENLLSTWEKVGEDDWFVRSFSNYNCKACVLNKYQDLFGNELDKYQYFLGTNGGLFALKTSGTEKQYWVKLHSDSLDRNQINVLKIDPVSKRLFVGTEHGLFSTDGIRLVFENSTDDTPIHTLDFLDKQELRQGMENILIGTDSGILQSMEGQYPKDFTLISSFVGFNGIDSMDEGNGVVYAALSTTLVSVKGENVNVLETIEGNAPIKNVVATKNGKVFYVGKTNINGADINDFVQYVPSGSTHYGVGTATHGIIGISKTSYDNLLIVYTDNSLSAFDASTDSFVNVISSPIITSTIVKIENIGNGKLAVWKKNNSLEIYEFQRSGEKDVYAKKLNGNNINSISTASNGKMFVSADGKLIEYGENKQFISSGCKILKNIDYTSVGDYYVLYENDSGEIKFEKGSFSIPSTKTDITGNFPGIKEFVLGTNADSDGFYIYYLTSDNKLNIKKSNDFSFIIASYAFSEDILGLTVINDSNIFVCGTNTLFKLGLTNSQEYRLTKNNIFNIYGLENANILEIKYQNSVSSILTLNDNGVHSISAIFPNGNLSSIGSFDSNISTVYFEKDIQEKTLSSSFYVTGGQQLSAVSLTDNSKILKNIGNIAWIDGGTYDLNGISHGKIYISRKHARGTWEIPLEDNFDVVLDKFENVQFNKDFSINNVPYVATTSGLYMILYSDGVVQTAQYYPGTNIRDIKICDIPDVWPYHRYLLGNSLSVTYSDFYDNTFESATINDIDTSNIQKIFENPVNHDLIVLSSDNNLVCLTSKNPTIVLNYQIVGTSCDLSTEANGLIYQVDIPGMFYSGLSSEILSSILSLQFNDGTDTTCKFDLSFDFSSESNDTFDISSVTIFNQENNEEYFSAGNIDFNLVSSYYIESENDVISTFYVLNLNISTTLSLNLDTYQDWTKIANLDVGWNEETDVSNHVTISNNDCPNAPKFDSMELIESNVNDFVLGNDCLLLGTITGIVKLDFSDYSTTTEKSFGADKLVNFAGKTYCITEGVLSCFETDTYQDVILDDNQYEKLTVSDSGKLFGLSGESSNWLEIVDGTTPYYDLFLKLGNNFDGNIWNGGNIVFKQSGTDLLVCKSRPCYDLSSATNKPIGNFGTKSLINIGFRQDESEIRNKSAVVVLKDGDIFKLGISTYQNGKIFVNDSKIVEISYDARFSNILKLADDNVIYDHDSIATYVNFGSSFIPASTSYDYSSGGIKTNNFVEFPGVNNASGGILNNLYYVTNDGIYMLSQTASKILQNNKQYSHAPFSTSKFYSGNVLFGTNENVLSMYRLDSNLTGYTTLSTFNLGGLEGNNYGFANNVPFYVSSDNTGKIGYDLSVTPIRNEYLSCCGTYASNPVFAGNNGLYVKTRMGAATEMTKLATINSNGMGFKPVNSFVPYGTNFVNDDLSSLVVSFSITSSDFVFYYLSSNFEGLSTQINSPVESILKDSDGNLYFYNSDFFAMYDKEKGYFDVNLPSGYGIGDIASLKNGVGNDILLASGNKIFEFNGTEIQRKFDTPRGQYSILRKRFYDKDIRTVEKIDDENFLIGTSDCARFVKNLRMALEPMDFDTNEILSGPVNTIQKVDRQVENGVETRYLYTSGRNIYSSDNNIELTKETTLNSEILGVNSIYSPAGGSLYCICTNDGLYVAEPGYVIKNDLLTYGILKIKNLQTELLSNNIEYHVAHDHGPDSFLTVLDSKCPAKLDIVPPNFTSNNRIGLYNEVEVIKNDIVERIEFNDNNKFVKASVKNWAIDILNGVNVYSESGFIDHFTDPIDGEEIDLSEIPYVCKFWNSGLKELVIYVPTTLTYYINNPKGFTNSIYNSDSIVRKNVSTTFKTENTISSKCTTLQILLANNHFGIKNIHNIQINGNSLPLRIYKDDVYCQKGRENIFDTIIQPSVLNSLPVLENQTGVNNINLMENSNNLVISFSIYGTDAQSIRILAE